MKKFLNWKKNGFFRVAALIALVLGLFTFAFAQFDDAPAADAGDAFNIDDLFGTFEPVTPDAPAAQVRTLPPFEGDYKILVSRPIYALFEPETRTRWVSAIGELHTHYKVASFPRTQMFTMEQATSVLPNSRDYSRRFSRQHYIEAARRIGATHLIFQEYQPNRDNRRAVYSMELYWLAETATVVRVSEEIVYSNFEEGLNSILAKIAEKIDPAAASTTAMQMRGIWGRDQKSIEALGNALSNEGDFIQENSEAVYAAIERSVTRQRPTTVGFQYAAALVAGRAAMYDKAVEHIQFVISQSGDYPALQLRLAEYLRGAERFPEAMSAVQMASRVSALSVAARIETARIYQAQNDLNRALAEYSALVESGNANGEVFFQLALLTVQMGRLADSDNYLRRAEEGGFTLDDNELFEIGLAYSKIPGQETKAIEFLRRSAGLRQTNINVWRAMAEIHERTGNQELMADAYVNMFKIQMHGNQWNLKTAGQIYEQLGKTDKAKDAYSLFIDRRFSDEEVSMNLARIYFNEQNCRRIGEILRGLDTIPEALEMLTGCNIRVRRIDESQTMEAKKLSPAMLALRIAGATMLAGGLTVGLIMNGQAESYYEDYRKFPAGYGGDGTPPDLTGNTPAQTEAGVKKLRDDIDSAIFLRNIMYGVAGAGLAGFAVTFFF